MIKTYQEICSTLQEMYDFEYSVKEVQYLKQMESHNKQLSRQGMVDNSGARPVDISNAYRILIDAYKLSHNVNDKKLEVFSERLQDLYYQNCVIHNYSVLTDETKKQKIKDNVLNNLRSDKSAYLSYANQFPNGRHINIVKYSQEEDGSYYKVFYNAGAGVRADNTKGLKGQYLKNIDPEQMVFYPAIKYPFKDKEALEAQIVQDIDDTIKYSNFLKIDEINKLNEEVAKRKESLIKAGPTKGILVKAQRVGNCTTRSTDEACRDNVPEEIFREFNDFVTNTKYSEMIEMLEHQKKTLEKAHDITPVRVENFNKFDSSLGGERFTLSPNLCQ